MDEHMCRPRARAHAAGFHWRGQLRLVRDSANRQMFLRSCCARGVPRTCKRARVGLPSSLRAHREATCWQLTTHVWAVLVWLWWPVAFEKLDPSRRKTPLD